MFQVSKGLSTRVISVLRKKQLTLGEWRQLPPPGLDPSLQNEPYQHGIFALVDFAARVRTGFYGNGAQIRAGSVSTALSVFVLVSF